MNPHDRLRSADFKSAVSADFTIRALIPFLSYLVPGRHVFAGNHPPSANVSAQSQGTSGYFRLCPSLRSSSKPSPLCGPRSFAASSRCSGSSGGSVPSFYWWGLASVSALINATTSNPLAQDIAICFGGKTALPYGGYAAGRDVTLTIDDAIAIREGSAAGEARFAGTPPDRE